MFIVMESDIFTIIGINPGECNNGTPQISADIFYNGFGITKIGFRIDIKTVFIFMINLRFCFLKGRTDSLFKFV